MATLSVYNFISVNGFFKGPGDDISWAHQNVSSEESEFAAENAQGGATLIFGRRTYQMMEGYWPTEEARKANAGVAEGMTKAEKIVFSKTLKKANWSNTRIVSDGLEEEVKKLKQTARHLTVLGSGTIVNQLADKGLIDELQLMVHPVAIANGTPLLNDIQNKLELELVQTKTFKSGILLLKYRIKHQVGV